MIGDGLAGTLYSFPNLKEDKKNRIIVFATDNSVDGNETVSLEEAATLCKQNGVNVYAYCPTTEMNIYAEEENITKYKKAIEKNADGKFFTGDLDKMTTNIVKEIKETKTSLLNKSKKTYVIDHPEAFFISTVILLFILIIIEKRIRL